MRLAVLVMHRTMHGTECTAKRTYILLMISETSAICRKSSLFDELHVCLVGMFFQ